MRSAEPPEYGRARLAAAELSGVCLGLSACAPPRPPPRRRRPRAATPPRGGPPAGAAAASADRHARSRSACMDDITGVGAIEGALMRISTELAVQRANASGGINGHPRAGDLRRSQGRRQPGAAARAPSSPSRTTSTCWRAASSAPSVWACRAWPPSCRSSTCRSTAAPTTSFTPKSCNKYTFRVYPGGRQIDDPAIALRGQERSARSGRIIYPDYALGQSDARDQRGRPAEERRRLRRPRSPCRSARRT